MTNGCKQCHNPIDVQGRAKGTGRPPVFCSYVCKERWHAAAKRQSTDRRLADRLCVVCSKPILTRSGKAKTCSRECGIKWQNDKRAAAKQARWEATRKPCARCGAELTDRRARSIYCSPECKKLTMGDRYRARFPGYQRRVKYGLSDERYDEMLAEQAHRCAICRTDKSVGISEKLHVDHDHGTGRVRGLLCNACNNGLGRFRDDPALLRAAADYLERPLG